MVIFSRRLSFLEKPRENCDRPLEIKHYRRLEDIEACHILFISSSESGRLKEILPALKDRNILTVGDTDGFTRNGGMIQFFTEQNKIRLRINENAAKAVRLTISSKQLRLGAK